MYRWHGVLDVASRSGVLVALVLASGCATLEVRKVALPLRACGADHRIQGFRYYLSRPYLVVSRPVTLLRYHEYGQLVIRSDALAIDSAMDQARGDQNRYAIKVVDESGKPRFLRLSGEPHVGQDESVWRPLRSASADETPDLRRLPPDWAVSTTRLAARSVDKTTEAEFEALQVIFLPDFEEQMAIRHRNLLAHGKYALRFRDGWQLKAMNGSFDSTEVPVQLLSTLRRAIGAAAELEERRVRSRADRVVEGERPGGANDQGHPTRVLITHTAYLEPGLYRLQKSVEMPCGHVVQGLGILTDLGIPLQTDITVRLLSDAAAPPGRRRHAPPSDPGAAAS